MCTAGFVVVTTFAWFQTCVIAYNIGLAAKQAGVSDEESGTRRVTRTTLDISPHGAVTSRTTQSDPVRSERRMDRHSRVEAGVVQNLQAAPSCVVTNGVAMESMPNEAPASFEDAKRVPANDSQNCYEPVNGSIGYNIDHAQCCCSFWRPEPQLLRDVNQIMASEDDIQHPSARACASSFAELAFEPPSHTYKNGVQMSSGSQSMGCGTVAIGVSGRVAMDRLDKYFGLMSKLVEQLQDAGETVDVFLHLGAKDESPLEKLPALPTWVKGLVLESKDNPQIEEAAATCTGGMVKELFSEMKGRYHYFRDAAQKSTLGMHRRIYLAYRMARAYAARASCNYQYYIRTRPEMKYASQYAVPWQELKAQIWQTPILTATVPWLYGQATNGVPTMQRCVVDDKVAIGNFAAMSAYTTLYPDFKDFVRYAPLYRRDFNGHTNERLLTAHLHYRVAQFKAVSFPFKGAHDGNVLGRRNGGWGRTSNWESHDYDYESYEPQAAEKFFKVPS